MPDLYNHSSVIPDVVNRPCVMPDVYNHPSVIPDVCNRESKERRDGAGRPRETRPYSSERA